MKMIITVVMKMIITVIVMTHKTYSMGKKEALGQVNTDGNIQVINTTGKKINAMIEREK